MRGPRPLLVHSSARTNDITQLLIQGPHTHPHLHSHVTACNVTIRASESSSQHCATATDIRVPWSQNQAWKRCVSMYKISASVWQSTYSSPPTHNNNRHPRKEPPPTHTPDDEPEDNATSGRPPDTVAPSTPTTNAPQSEHSHIIHRHGNQAQKLGRNLCDLP